MNNKNYLWLLVVSLFILGSFSILPSGFSQEEEGIKTEAEESESEGASFEEIMKLMSSAAKEAEAEKTTAAEADISEEEEEYSPILRIESIDGDRFSMEFRNLEIKDLLRVIAHNYDMNILVNEDIRGKVTASFSNVTLDQALDAILSDNGLISEQQGDILKVKPNLISEVFTLEHIEAKKLIGSEEGVSGSTLSDLLSQDGKMFLGQMPNSVLVVDYPKNMEKIGNYIGAIDQEMESRVFKLKYLSVKDIVGEEK